MTAKEVRAEVASLLEGLLPADVLVRPYLFQPDNVPLQGLVMVGLDGGGPAPEWGCGLTYRVEVVLAVGSSKPGTSDDNLDDLLDLVLGVLDESPSSGLVSWVRGVLAGTASHPSYSVSLEVVA